MLVGICWEHQMINSSLRFYSILPLICSFENFIVIFIVLGTVLHEVTFLQIYMMCKPIFLTLSTSLFSFPFIPIRLFGPQDRFTSIFISHIHISLYALIKRHLGTTSTIFDLRAHTQKYFLF